MEQTPIQSAGTLLLPGLPPNMPAISRILSRFERDQLEGFIAVAIDLLDVADGDPDAEVEDPAGETVAVIDDPEAPPEESDGDSDLEETDSEESFVLSTSALAYARGPGCTISDPGGGSVDDEGEMIDEREPDHDEDHPDYAEDQTKGPLAPHLADDRTLRRPFIDRVRRDKCRQLTRPNYYGATYILEGN